jgi:hypothetical protein
MVSVPAASGHEGAASADGDKAASSDGDGDASGEASPAGDEHAATATSSTTVRMAGVSPHPAHRPPQIVCDQIDYDYAGTCLRSGAARAAIIHSTANSTYAAPELAAAIAPWQRHDVETSVRSVDFHSSPASHATDPAASAQEYRATHSAPAGIASSRPVRVQHDAARRPRASISG